MPFAHCQRQIDLDFTLKRIFNKSSFRPPQREVIHSTLQGHDVFLQAATSFGKSLCFQLPAVVDTGMIVARRFPSLHVQVVSFELTHSIYDFARVLFNVSSYDYDQQKQPFLSSLERVSY